MIATHFLLKVGRVLPAHDTIMGGAEAMEKAARGFLIMVKSDIWF
ncbi:MAG: hypothetical protein ABF566_06360 [Acetobacter sp.]